MPEPLLVTTTGMVRPTFSLTGTLPAGVTFDTVTGVLSGTPAFGTSGTYALTITANNAFFSSDTEFHTDGSGSTYNQSH